MEKQELLNKINSRFSEQWEGAVEKAELSYDFPVFYINKDKIHDALAILKNDHDFYGVKFKGHPNLKRILNVDEMDIFPLRKEYPLEDQSREDKSDKMFGR